MNKKMAWDTFKNTGNIDAFLEFKQIKDMEENIQKVEQNGNDKNKWNNNIGE